MRELGLRERKFCLELGASPSARAGNSVSDPRSLFVLCRIIDRRQDLSRMFRMRCFLFLPYELPVVRSASGVFSAVTALAYCKRSRRVFSFRSICTTLES